MDGLRILYSLAKNSKWLFFSFAKRVDQLACLLKKNIEHFIFPDKSLNRKFNKFNEHVRFVIPRFSNKKKTSFWFSQ